MTNNLNPKKIKNNLIECVKSIVENKEKFVENPDKDFTRNRKITLEDLINCTLQMTCGSNNKEIFNFYISNKKNMPSVSAFVQQRDKLSSEAYKFLFDTFTSTIQANKTFKGYRLLACDGSDIRLPLNVNDKDTYIDQKTSTGHNHLHLNVLYDVLNCIYLDAVIQSVYSQNENKALLEMFKQIDNSEKVIVMALAALLLAKFQIKTTG